ncbi:hypothetical protein BT69DRAFT_1334221 [Atractiella rhizophila]|nr:hypothetical protein BT69DRAFT_1334221 [Atractiella rhizophila]
MSSQPVKPTRPPPPSPSLVSDFKSSAAEKTKAPSIADPDPNALTPLRAHYLKRELITLQIQREISTVATSEALFLFGSPFLPKSRFLPNGQPNPNPPQLSAEEKQREREQQADLPLIRFIFHQFVVTFPFLKNCGPTFWSHKVQPFIHSFFARNISSSEDREEATKRRRLFGKVEKHLGLIVSAAIKVNDNNGAEEVVRVTSTSHPFGARHQASTGPVYETESLSINVGALSSNASESEQSFSVNVVTVRNIVTKGRVRNKHHEEFIIRTKSKDGEVYVSRRYGDFLKLSEELRSEYAEADIRPPPPKDRRSVEVRSQSTGPSPRRSEFPTSTSEAFEDSQYLMPGDISSSPPSTSAFSSNASTHHHHDKHLPNLARERNRLTLRAYLHSLLANDALASSETMRSFLLESPTTLTDSELRDVAVREEMDRIREEETRQFQEEVEIRVKELESSLRQFREDLVKSDGLTEVFATIRRTPRVEDLPLQYRKVLEWGRISLASTLYQLFLGSDDSSSTFNQLKRIHGMIPYLLLRGVLKISNPVAMIRAALDLFLARPFGQTSLLQRIFSSTLTEDIRELRADIEKVAAKVRDDRLVQKVQNFVNAPKEIQDVYRLDAEMEKIDIIHAILRAPEDPVLDRAAFIRVHRASGAYEEYKKIRDALANPDDDEGPDNEDAWLFEDLHVILRMATRLRDKEQMIALIFEGSTSELLKDIITMFYEPLAKVYKAANISDCIYDLQMFVNDLIKTVEEAENASVSDPRKVVQQFIDLISRHLQAGYNFVHQVHAKGEDLFDNLMAWIQLFIDFVRDGLPDKVTLEWLLPHGGEERANVIAEVDQIIDYHRKLKLLRAKKLARGERHAADRNQDETAFVSGVLSNLHIGAIAGDVEDAQVEDFSESDSEDEADVTESSDEEEFHTPTFLDRTPTTHPMQLRQDSSTSSINKPLPSPPAQPRKKRNEIQPPTLKYLPEMSTVFVEMIRHQLRPR